MTLIVLICPSTSDDSFLLFPSSGALTSSAFFVLWFSWSVVLYEFMRDGKNNKIDFAFIRVHFFPVLSNRLNFLRIIHDLVQLVEKAYTYESKK